MILVLDTAKEEVFIGLWNKEKSVWATSEVFAGGRELNKLIIQKLDDVIKNASTEAIIVNAGPGSFTGLRIGMSVANTFAYAKDIPIVAPENNESTDMLLQKGLNMLKSAGSQFDFAVTPHYGAEPHITKPKN